MTEKYRKTVEEGRVLTLEDFLEQANISKMYEQYSLDYFDITKEMIEEHIAEEAFNIIKYADEEQVREALKHQLYLGYLITFIKSGEIETAVKALEVE